MTVPSDGLSTPQIAALPVPPAWPNNTTETRRDTCSPSAFRPRPPVAKHPHAHLERNSLRRAGSPVVCCAPLAPPRASPIRCRYIKPRKGTQKKNDAPSSEGNSAEANNKATAAPPSCPRRHSILPFFCQYAEQQDLGLGQARPVGGKSDS